MPSKRDIVYILRPDIDPSELTYSLRSIEKNFPYRKVWFVCGQPKGLEPDGRIEHIQTGETKWDKIKSSMLMAARTDEVSEEFFLFNDDFFVMKKFKGEFVNYVDMTLEEKTKELRERNPWLNPYGRTLLKAEQELKTLGCPTMNYDVHLPMLMNKETVKKTIDKCASPQFRSVYGNYNRIPYVIHPDVKVYDKTSVPENPDFLSTDDGSFNDGAVGEYIRNKFSKPSRFEVDLCRE